MKTTNTHLDPVTSFIHAIAGVSQAERPRQKSAVNCWAKAQKTSPNDRVRLGPVSTNVDRRNNLTEWNRVAKEEFSKLSDDEKTHWEKQAKEDHARVMQEWKAARDGSVSTRPEDRQRCIEGIVRLGQEFLDQLAERTGWKWSLIGGGPEPASEGRLTIIGLHGGTIRRKPRLNFGQHERELYSSHILPVYSKFLQECYTPEDCTRQAWSSTSGAIPLDEEELEAQGINYDLALSSEDCSAALLYDTAAEHQPAPSSGPNSSPIPTFVAVEPPRRGREVLMAHEDVPSPSPVVTSPSSPMQRGVSASPISIHTDTSPERTRALDQATKTMDVEPSFAPATPVDAVTFDQVSSHDSRSSSSTAMAHMPAAEPDVGPSSKPGATVPSTDMVVDSDSEYSQEAVVEREFAPFPSPGIASQALGPPVHPPSLDLPRTVSPPAVPDVVHTTPPPASATGSNGAANTLVEEQSFLSDFPADASASQPAPDSPDVYGVEASNAVAASPTIDHSVVDADIDLDLNSTGTSAQDGGDPPLSFFASYAAASFALNTGFSVKTSTLSPPERARGPKRHSLVLPYAPSPKRRPS